METPTKPRRTRRLRLRKEWRQFPIPPDGRTRKSVIFHLRSQATERMPAGQGKPDRWILTVSECFHKDLPEKRELSLSLRCVPLAYSVFAGKGSLAILADWLEDHPEDVLAVTGRRSRWAGVPGTIGDEYGRAAKEKVAEPDWEVLARVLTAMRQAV